MEEQAHSIVESSERLSNKSMETIDKLFDVAHPDAVFSTPIEAGEVTVITAAEVSVGMGLGFGGGYGTEEEEDESEFGSGLGGGGGGFTAARPVAAIVIDEDGVMIEPIVDQTKIALAFLTAAASMIVMLSRIFSSGRR